MPLADFASIPTVGPATALPALSYYDPTWGFFTFSQRLSTTYNDARAFRSRATFQISGEFTCDAEQIDPDTNASDAFLALTAKYEHLESMFANAGKQPQPNNPAAWFTAADTRCIRLPDPIKDSAGNALYVLPEHLQLMEGQYALSLRYQASLVEGDLPAATILLNNLPLNDSEIVIEPPKPIATRHRMVAGEGSLIQVRNYTRTTVSVSGVMPLAAGESLSDACKTVMESLVNGTFSLAMYKWAPGGAAITTLFNDLAVDSPTVDIRPVDRGVSVSVKGAM